jgi:RNase_H superfamily
MTAAISLQRRLANYRAGLGDLPAAAPAASVRRRRVGAEALAATLNGELVLTERGAFVRVEAPSTLLPLDRDRLATLPGQPPASSPLLCLDTETTGLATAAGTLAFLVGLGWWEGSRFRQVQLLLPDHADEPALLEELARHVPVNAWLVTYNGRGFDWPLIVARYRLARSAPPIHAGHLDLLPIVRRLFRHRTLDARLGTVESVLLGVRRHGDVAGWEIPERYFTFLAGGEPGPLVDVVRHNDEDVRSLGRLLVHLDRHFADRERWPDADPGDLAGLARAFSRDGRHEEALTCIERSLAGLRRRGASSRPVPPDATAPSPRVAETPVDWPALGRASRLPDPPLSVADDDDVWWSARRRPDFGGRSDRYPRPDSWPAADPVRRDATWSIARAAAERARLLRRLGRHSDAEAAWLELTSDGGTLAILAWIEIAKTREHRLADLDGALAATELARRAIERQRFLGRPLPRLELAAGIRSIRLSRRIRRRQATSATRRRTAASVGTPAIPCASTASEAAAAARPSRSAQVDAASRSPSTSVASNVARNTSPAPVGSITRSAGIDG